MEGYGSDMEPITLYMLLSLAGDERLSKRHFPSREDCERYAADVVAKTPPKGKVLNSACWPQGKTPPTWVSDRPIVGVPLDLRWVR